LPIDKANTILPYIESVAEGDLSILDGAFATINVRLQPEKKEKERTYLYCRTDGEVVEETVTAEDRYDSKLHRYGSRTRTVFNYPIPNLACQIFDNAQHKGLLKSPMFGRDMMGWAASHRKVSKLHYAAFDFKNFDRYTGFATTKWAKLVGGIYGEAVLRMLDLPFLVPSVGKGQEHWRPMFVKHSSQAHVLQLGSGLSPVAPIQKILMLAVYTAYFVEKKGMSIPEAITSLTFQQGALVIDNYGDDNFLSADTERDLTDVEDFLKAILPLERETPPAFLGMEYTQDGFRLQAVKYIINWFLNERMPGGRFRPYPEHGWRARNDIYLQIGDPIISAEILPWLEGELLPRFGITKTWRDRQYDYEAMGMQEQHISSRATKLLVLEKQYQLTDEEKAAMPNYYSILSQEYCESVYHRIGPKGRS
jgi:hypothetical protein